MIIIGCLLGIISGIRVDQTINCQITKDVIEFATLPSIISEHNGSDPFIYIITDSEINSTDCSFMSVSGTPMSTIQTPGYACSIGADAHKLDITTQFTPKSVYFAFANTAIADEEPAVLGTCADVLKAEQLYIEDGYITGILDAFVDVSDMKIPWWSSYNPFASMTSSIQQLESAVDDYEQVIVEFNAYQTNYTDMTMDEIDGMNDNLTELALIPPMMPISANPGNMTQTELLTSSIETYMDATLGALNLKAAGYLIAPLPQLQSDISNIVVPNTIHFPTEFRAKINSWSLLTFETVSSDIELLI